MSGIELNHVTKVYSNGVTAVDGLSLDIHDGEFMVLVGPSGCGKSTLLRMIAGLEEVSDGSVHVAGRDVTRMEPRDRDIAMVFQNYALYPHMTVWSNLAFALKLRRTPRGEVAERVDEAARILGLQDLYPRRPAKLSGGQRQRVAIGRAMVREPKAFLMDEPLSNLDAKLRVAMRGELARLHKRLGSTIIYVTHDQVEALTLGDRVAVLRDGVLQQCAPPRELFDRPANVFVAAFIGSPAMNLVAARVVAGGVEFGGHRLALEPALLERVTDNRAIVGIRPSDLTLAGPGAAPGGARMRVTAEVVEHLGDETHVMFLLDAPRLQTDATRAATDSEAIDDEQLIMDDERARFTARLYGRASVQAGDALELAVDVTRLQLFDSATGEALGSAASELVGGGSR